MSFTTPLAFILLLALPYVVWLGRPRLAGRQARRDHLSLAVRLVILLLLTFSLAGTQIVQAADSLAVVFLIDGSDSIGPEQAQQAETFVREAIAAMPPDDAAAVVVFGSDALVERPLSSLAELGPLTSTPRRLHSDMAEAIRLGLALLPAGRARRLVILSDGRPTTGDVDEAMRLAETAGVTIDVVPLLRNATGPEAAITTIDAPARLSQGERFSLQVNVLSNRAMDATLRVLSGGAVVAELGVSLQVGNNRFELPRDPPRLTARTQQFSRYQVQLSPAEDTYFQNNELAAFTDIVGPPRVLLIANDGQLDDNGNPLPDESPALRLALTAAGLGVTVTAPDDLPSDQAALSNYAAIVLVNINAKRLSPRKMAALQTYVRDLGGGLVAVGGPESYGMGGYFRTPLEETLPVSMRITDQERFPSVSIAIVIDRSGSMSAPEGGLTKIQLADEAAVRVVELLNDFDEISVIPVDTAVRDMVGPVSAAARTAVIEEIRRIGAGGGGINVRTGLEAADRALAGSENEVRHIIVLADGADANEKSGVEALIKSLTGRGVTVSMVAIGDGPDVPWLQDMAALGNGRFHFTDQAANLPQIFTQETTNIQRSYLVEERFFPDAGPDYRLNAMLRGISEVPPLLGYVATGEKATAQSVLETPQGDPLLAAWQYGLGRSVAWTSDAGGRWADEWVRWEQFPTFWAQVVRWTIAGGRENNIETVVQLDEDEALLIVDARDGQGGFLNDVPAAANVVSPGGETQELILAQVASGRYEGRFVPDETGAYFIRVAGGTADAATFGQTAGWVLGYSPEYRDLDADPDFLASLADRTGGRVLDGETTAVFEHNLPAEATARPIWPGLMLLAVLLWPVDIALRRLIVSRRDVTRAWAAATARFRPAPVPRERPARVSRLFDAKERASRRLPEVGEGTRPLPPIAAPPAEPTPSPPPETTAEDDTLAARLLARRRQRDEEANDN